MPRTNVVGTTAAAGSGAQRCAQAGEHRRDNGGQSPGHFADGALAEIFITNGKAGSDSDTAARDSAVVASIALQFGVPLDVLRHALMRDAQGRPAVPLGTALDFVAKQERAS